MTPYRSPMPATPAVQQLVQLRLDVEAMVAPLATTATERALLVEVILALAATSPRSIRETAADVTMALDDWRATPAGRAWQRWSAPHA